MSRPRAARPQGLAFTFWRRPDLFRSSGQPPAAHLLPVEGKGFGEQRSPINKKL